MSFKYCDCLNCKYATNHTTAYHICGKCGNYGHGRMECSNPVRMSMLNKKNSGGFGMPSGMRCTINGCRNPMSHKTEAHHCSTCKKLVRYIDGTDHNTTDSIFQLDEKTPLAIHFKPKGNGSWKKVVFREPCDCRLQDGAWEKYMNTGEKTPDILKSLGVSIIDGKEWTSHRDYAEGGWKNPYGLSTGPKYFPLPCNYYQKGRCRFGSNCKDLHLIRFD